jgi:hypothetical protein
VVDAAVPSNTSSVADDVLAAGADASGAAAEAEDADPPGLQAARLNAVIAESMKDPNRFKFAFIVFSFPFQEFPDQSLITAWLKPSPASDRRAKHLSLEETRKSCGKNQSSA